MPAIIVTGPPGSGKTRHAEALAAHFDKLCIVDEWEPNQPQALPANTLALTQHSLSEADAARLGARVIPIDRALREAGIDRDSGQTQRRQRQG